MSRTSTKERLAKALEDCLAPQDMIARARAGYYDDYESELATPIIQLVFDCEAAGLTGLANQVRAGEFDGTREEGEAWYQRDGPRLSEEGTP